MTVVGEDNKEIPISKIKNEKSVDFRENYVTGTMGGAFGPYDFRMTFYDMKIVKDDEDYFELRTEKSSVIMPYAAAKQLYLWLGKQLGHYEEQSGQEIYIGQDKDPARYDVADRV